MGAGGPPCGGRQASQITAAKRMSPSTKLAKEKFRACGHASFWRALTAFSVASSEATILFSRTMRCPIIILSTLNGSFSGAGA